MNPKVLKLIEQVRMAELEKKSHLSRSQKEYINNLEDSREEQPGMK